MKRRQFLNTASLSIGSMALSALLNPASATKGLETAPTQNGDFPHFQGKVKKIIYLFQSGGPSQFETFDYKPVIEKRSGEELPDSVRKGQRLTAMSADQTSLPMAPSIFSFKQYGDCGQWVSELMPYTAEVVDDLCFIKSLFTEQINHDPAITFFQTGHQLAGRPSIGAWLSYGLGSLNDNLPTFIVLVSNNGSGQPVYARLWGNGFLPTEHQGVQFRSGKDPVLYLNNPQGYENDDRRRMLDYLKNMNDIQYRESGDPEVRARITQYEMAFRMQSAVPDVADMSDEPEHIFKLYGPDSRIPGTYAANCLLARKLVEKNVRFVQLYHRGWDQHSYLPNGIKRQCQNTDQPTAALIKDLKQRGLLEDTLVVWGGEFGRTVYSQGKLTADNYGRDHHPRCFTMWMAGAGVKAGFTLGKTDDFSYNIIENPVHVHDFQATLMHLFGMDHERLIFKHQGRRYRLTDVHGKVVESILA